MINTLLLSTALATSFTAPTNINQFPATNVFELANHAYQVQKAIDKTVKPYIIIVDFTLPSTSKRLWVYNVNTKTFLYNTYTTHGQTSGDISTTWFSNKEGSHASIFGVFRTSYTYIGKNGYSLKIQGLEPLNANTESRNIVIHKAYYASQEYLNDHGKLGRSWGCFALDPAVSKQIIDTVKNNSLMFVFVPDPYWMAQSKYLR